MKTIPFGKKQEFWDERKTYFYSWMINKLLSYGRGEKHSTIDAIEWEESVLRVAASNQNRQDEERGHLCVLVWIDRNLRHHLRGVCFQVGPFAFHLLATMPSSSGPCTASWSCWLRIRSAPSTQRWPSCSPSERGACGWESPSQHSFWGPSWRQWSATLTSPLRSRIARTYTPR